MKKWCILPCIALALDRFAKAWAQCALAPHGSAVLWPGVLGLRYARNTGVAFSLGANLPWLIPALTAALCLAVLAFAWRAKAYPPPARGGLLLIAAGGLSNLADRLIYGYVVDFIQLLFVHFAIFNLADVMICAGAALTALTLLRPKEVPRRGMDR